VRFEDVDAAGIVFFARFFGYCHDAMDGFFEDVVGGYVGLITQRKVGFPVVHASSDFKASIGYGDIARIAGTVTKLGTTASHFRFVMTRVRDGAHVATMNHVHVCTDLRTMTKVPLPADVRAALEKHLRPDA
jgi:4-hydroxybenzoyl-CoA thioesterase